jgi:hypothetical protein
MITSFTREVIMVPKAAPIMMPMAMSNTFPRMANSLNSFNIFSSFLKCHSCESRACPALDAENPVFKAVLASRFPGSDGVLGVSPSLIE